MLLDKLKKIIIFTTLLIGILLVAYLSKPDRGGLSSCEEIFGLDSLSRRGLEISHLWKWKLFENRKFRMKIKSGGFNNLKVYLIEHGYKKWDGGGLEYGSFVVGCGNLDQFESSFKKFGSHVHIIGHDKRENFIYAIVSQ